MSQGLGGEATLRPKRQLTLPAEICAALDIEPGDLLELSVEGRVLTARPKKAKAMDALQEIRDSFERSGITEAELLKSGRSMRRTMSRERHGG
ncbi:MAG: AbrB/MazE/SpoVT family DNA-binding domain-containing protein [Actinobacteria bacterium]|jgi:AbrB family looped-hinge helix DNA binding protein|nr:MAG: AbrB/MazE/SpoVT family DNA-binding domain-containing protein [Actinomycetota bacterium]